MSISEILRTDGNIQLVINSADLREFAETIIEGANHRRDAELEQMAKVKPADEYLTADEASEMLRVSKPTLWRWAKRDIIKPIKVGCNSRYRKADIVSLMRGECGDEQ